MLHLLLVSLLFAMSSKQNPLAPYTWKNRMLLIQCDGRDGSACIKTMSELEKSTNELRERDLVVISYCEGQIKVDGEETNEPKAAQLKTLFETKFDAFQLQLIGKDGGRKLVSSEYTPLQDIFGVIDAMPMRKSEIRRSGGG